MEKGWADAICPALERGDEVVLATVIHEAGGGFWFAGSKMIVNGDQSSVGSIGGGVLEAEGQRRAGDVFRSGFSQVFACDYRGSAGSGAPMRVEVFLDLIDAAGENIELFKALREAQQRGERHVVVADLGPGDEIREVRRCLVKEDGTVIGTFEDPASVKRLLSDEARRYDRPVLKAERGHRFLVEYC